ncbi:MAG: hypothetical protein H6Q17_1148 [Bacteroidetes bacterium]|jgi:hypothetical protein|nr:hypothetical protein [Bacteroidota bacterium]
MFCVGYFVILFQVVFYPKIEQNLRKKGSGIVATTKR